MTSERLQAWFLKSSAVVLTVTGLAKLFTATGPTRALDVADPILGIPFRHVLLVVGLVELVIAAVCFLGKNRQLATLLVAWLATSFLIYRLGLWWMGWHKPCGCLGNLTDVLHISPQAADNIIKLVLAYLLIGSYGLLVRQWRRLKSFPSHGPPIDSPLGMNH